MSVSVYAYEVSRPFVTPEVELLRHDVVLVSERECRVLQGRGGVVTTIHLAADFARYVELFRDFMFVIASKAGSTGRIWQRMRMNDRPCSSNHLQTKEGDRMAADTPRRPTVTSPSMYTLMAVMASDPIAAGQWAARARITARYPIPTEGVEAGDTLILPEGRRDICLVRHLKTQDARIAAYRRDAIQRGPWEVPADCHHSAASVREDWLRRWIPIRASSGSKRTRRRRLSTGMEAVTAPTLRLVAGGAR